MLGSPKKVELMVIDEIGFVPLHKDAAELLFQVISDCYERKSLIITSHLEFSQWNTVFGDNRLTATLVDRLIQYCKDYNLGKYYNHNEEHPLPARITCQTCGCSFVFLRSKRVGEEGRGYWRCSSFQGEHGMAVEGRTFTPSPMALWSKSPDSPQARYRAKHRKLPKERQMLCTDIQVSACAPEKAFVQPWNLVVSQGLQHIVTESEDMLARYRAGEMVRLLSEVGRIDRFDYKLSLKVLDHIEVTPAGKITMIFLDGTRITV